MIGANSAFVTFVRHGESESNVVRRWQGHGDSPLSPEGREQARRLGERLAGITIDRVITSDLQRAHDTALALGHPVTVDPTWREIDVGAWEGLTRAEVRERFPEEIAALSEGKMVPIGGGESWLDLAARIDAQLAKLRETLVPGEHVVVASHGGVVATIVSGLFKTRAMRPSPFGRIQNTAVTTVAFDPERGPRLVRFCDASHNKSVSTWAEERRAEHGDTTIALISPEPRQGEPPAGGRLRDNGALASAERLAKWYRADEVFVGSDVDTRNAASTLAWRWETELGEPVADDVADAVATLRKLRPGKRVALVTSPDRARAYVNQVLETEAVPFSRGLTTLSRSDRVTSVIDANVTRAFTLPSLG